MKDEFTPYTPNPEKIIELFEKLEKGETLGKRSKGFLVAGKYYKIVYYYGTLIAPLNL